MLARSSIQKQTCDLGSRAFLLKIRQRTTPVVDLLKRFAKKKNATPAQIALAWLLAQKPWIVPIPGTRNIEHLNENLGAVNVQLTSDDLREIETAISKITVHGDRMSEMHLQQIDRS
jgi:aryl-alcohol dehydrogenase-like predicted oxidoreductase